MVLPLLAAVLPLAVAGGCGPLNCKPTELEAREAGVINLSKQGPRWVLQARLTVVGSPVPDKPIQFLIHSEGEYVHIGEAKTDQTGWARFHLKDADPATLARLVRADAWQAVYRARKPPYCKSSDEADIALFKG